MIKRQEGGSYKNLSDSLIKHKQVILTNVSKIPEINEQTFRKLLNREMPAIYQKLPVHIQVIDSEVYLISIEDTTVTNQDMAFILAPDYLEER